MLSLTIPQSVLLPPSLKFYRIKHKKSKYGWLLFKTAQPTGLIEYCLDPIDCFDNWDLSYNITRIKALDEPVFIDNKGYCNEYTILKNYTKEEFIRKCNRVISFANPIYMFNKYICSYPNYPYKQYVNFEVDSEGRPHGTCVKYAENGSFLYVKNFVHGVCQNDIAGLNIQLKFDCL